MAWPNPRRTADEQAAYDETTAPAGISETLRRIEDRVATVADNANKMSDKLDNLSQRLLDPNTGIVVQLNDVKSFVAAQRWMMKGLIATAGGAALVGAVAYVVSVLTHGAVHINQ
jgi:hypothetical protein